MRRFSVPLTRSITPFDRGLYGLLVTCLTSELDNMNSKSALTNSLPLSLCIILGLASVSNSDISASPMFFASLLFSGNTQRYLLNASMIVNRYLTPLFLLAYFSMSMRSIFHRVPGFLVMIGWLTLFFAPCFLYLIGL